MMLKLRNTSCLFLTLVILIVCISCNNEDEPIVKPRPSLSVNSLNLEVGDSAILHIENTDSVISAITNAPQVISLRINGSNIIVQALSQGNAVITINAHGARLQCDVVVNESQIPQPDFDKELQDERSRFVSPFLSLYYDTPGTIFSVSSNNVIEVRSLITGDNISFNPDTTTLQEGNLPNASLYINGNKTTLRQATLQRLSPNGSMWFNLLDTNGNQIVLVVTDI